MTAKQYLSRAYNLRRRIAAKEMRLVELRVQAEHITANMDGMPHGSAPGSPVERAAVQLSDLYYEIQDDLLSLLEYSDDIAKTIERIEDPVLYQLLSMRYLSYKSWREIADAMHYSTRHVTRLHRKALCLIDDVLECP